MTSSRPSDDNVGLAVLAVIGVGALVASSSYLAELARATGWTSWSSWLLPLTVDVLAGYGVRGWVRPSSTNAQRRTGRIVALSMLAVSIGGNAVSHLVTTGTIVPGPVLVVLVGSIPPVGLFVAVHLHTLGTVPVPSRRPSRRPVPVVQPELDRSSEVPTEAVPQLEPLHSVPAVPADDVARVRELDSQHLTEHGKPISRDKVRAVLGCGNAKAGRLLEAARKTTMERIPA